MIEFYLGKGSVIATQLALTEDFDTEPMAAEVLKRLLAYLGQGIFAPKRTGRSIRMRSWRFCRAHPTPC